MPELLDTLLNGPSRYTQEHHFEPWLTLVFVIGILLAGYESLNWHPFLSDFILVGQKLEQLGFTYFKGVVTVVDPLEVQ